MSTDTQTMPIDTGIGQQDVATDNRPDPGEGWCLLQADDIVIDGDECWWSSLNAWRPASSRGSVRELGDCVYRRRTAPIVTIETSDPDDHTPASKAAVVDADRLDELEATNRRLQAELTAEKVRHGNTRSERDDAVQECARLRGEHESLQAQWRTSKIVIDRLNDRLCNPPDASEQISAAVDEATAKANAEIERLTKALEVSNGSYSELWQQVKALKKDAAHMQALLTSAWQS